MVWTRPSADTRRYKNVWSLHGGVPILTAENMVRPASSEEYREKELLGTEGQEARGLLYEEVRGPGLDNLDLEFNQHTWTTSRREQDQKNEDSSKEEMKMKMDRERG